MSWPSLEQQIVASVIQFLLLLFLDLSQTNMPGLGGRADLRLLQRNWVRHHQHAVGSHSCKLHAFYFFKWLGHRPL
jgi:hypothetical protein